MASACVFTVMFAPKQCAMAWPLRIPKTHDNETRRYVKWLQDKQCRAVFLLKTNPWGVPVSFVRCDFDYSTRTEVDYPPCDKTPAGTP